MLKRVILIFILSSISVVTLLASYQITGRINLSEDWQRQIFLATVNKLDDYHKAKPADIIQVATILEDGTFNFEGNNLPNENRFYRLYLLKEENSEYDACFYFSADDYNFVHLILNNETKIEINADPTFYAPFGNYTIIGNEENKALAKVNHLIFPSFNYYQIKFPSELQFTQQKLNRDLFEVANSTSHLFVGLAAIINTDMDEYYPFESSKYEAFANRLKSEYPNHNYTKDYLRKLMYYSGDYTSTQIPNWVFSLLGLLLIGLLVAIRKVIHLKSEVERQKFKKERKPKVQLSNQEEKILSLILEEKSNKEIASELFIEVSTVKTHINKLYSKLEVKNRKEAKLKAKNLAITRV